MVKINVTPSAQKDQLFTLIKSLTKAEKRNFKLYAQRTQNSANIKFIQLFDTLDKLLEYEDDTVFKKMRGMKKGQLANLKRHLYKQILISLRLIHISKNVDIQIREQLDFAKILYGKGLYLQSLKLLDRIKPIAFEKHQDLLHLEILEFQKLIEERHITRSRSIKNKVENLIEESDKRSAIIHNTSKLGNLKIEIHGFYIQFGHAKNEKDTIIVRELFKSRLSNIETSQLTFFEKIYLYQAYVWYYYILLDFPRCYRYSLKWVELFQANPNMKEEDQNLYMRGLHYLLTSLFNMGNLEKLDYYINEFDQFLEEFNEKFNINSETIAFLYSYPSKLNKFYLEGNFEEGIKLVPEILDKLELYEKHLDPHRIMVFYYKIAYLYVGNGDYDKALDYLNDIINLRVGHLREDIQCYARLLQLIAHFELGNYELLEYLATSVQRFLSKMQELDQLQIQTLKFIRSICKKLPSQHHKAFVDFRRELRKIAKDPFEKRAFLYLDILSWVESKIKGLPLKDIIRERWSSQ